MKDFIGRVGLTGTERAAVEGNCPESGLCIFLIRSQSSIWVSSGTCIHIVIQIHIQSQRYAMLCNKGGTGTKTVSFGYICYSKLGNTCPKVLRPANWSVLSNYGSEEGGVNLHRGIACTMALASSSAVGVCSTADLNLFLPHSRLAIVPAL